MPTTPRVLPGAEPFSAPGAAGGAAGALLCHGFTGSPASLRPWAEHLAAAGLAVELPRLPGHGTTWREMQVTRWEDWYATLERALLDLRSRCDSVFVMGLSAGGTLALRLAEQHGPAVSGLVLVNPSLVHVDWRQHALPLLKLLVPVFPGISNDIRKPGQDEVAYDRVPLRAFASLRELWAVTRRDLALVTQPVLVFRSAVDHVVKPDSARLLATAVSSTDLEERVLPDSYHVATLDNDAPTIFAGSLDFLRRLSPQPIAASAAGER